MKAKVFVALISARCIAHRVVQCDAVEKGYSTRLSTLH